MGQRHQVFLIARLVPHGSTDGKAYYRCVVARHHQWCYGTLPLAATYRFVTLLKNPNNAEIIRDELRPWDTDLGHLEEPYASDAGFDRGCFSPNMGSFDGDNNDGITIIDITDPTNPAYCFVLGRGGVPADGRCYISRYYTLPSVRRDTDKKVDAREPDFELGLDEEEEGEEDGEEEDGEEDGEEEEEEEEEEDFTEDAEATGMAGRIREVVSDLEGVRLITSAMLAEAWPREYAATQPEENSSAPDSEETIDNALSSEDRDQLEQLGEMAWMPGKAELMKKALTRKNPFPDTAMTLLTKILAHELETTSPSVLDLSVLLALSPDQIVFVLKSLGTTSDIKSLNLSGNQNISVAVVTDALTILPKLLRLVLLNTSIANEDLSELMSSSPKLFYNLHDLVHPVFLRPICPSRQGRRITLEALHPAYRHGITIVIADSHSQGALASVPFFNLDKLISCLDYQMTVLTSPKNRDPRFNYSYSQSALGPLIAMSTSTTIVSSGNTKDGDEKGKEKSAETVGVSGGNNYDSRTISSIPRAHSMDCFEGVGWMFVLSTSMHSVHGPAYGFVKVDPEAMEEFEKLIEAREEAAEAAVDNSGSSEAPPRPIQSTKALWKIYDVRRFVDEMIKEGRPAPSEDVVLSFERTVSVSGMLDDDEKSKEVGEDIVDMPGMPPFDREAMARMLRDSKILRLISDSEFQSLKRSCEMMVALRWGGGF
ncbi:hypothetical protein VKT23_016982 [Stygiomarasmius scandens]|uniref:Uncharacterized protein n=1 Tax=Marasmiellus scandens TaxID=2682957 RepID=A0ABR1IWE6_9AGAR